MSGFLSIGKAKVIPYQFRHVNFFAFLLAINTLQLTYAYFYGITIIPAVLMLGITPNYGLIAVIVKMILYYVGC